MDDRLPGTPAISSYQGRKRIWPAVVLFLLFAEQTIWARSQLGLPFAVVKGYDALGLCACVWLGVRDGSAAYWLILTPHSLRWVSRFRRGEIPLADLQRMSKRWDGFAVIESAGRRRLPIDVKLPDQRRLATDLKRAAPHMEVTLRRQPRIGGKTLASERPE